MGCRNCDEKKSRHSGMAKMPVQNPGDVDSPGVESVGRSFKPDPNTIQAGGGQDPLSSLVAARNFSYEELRAKKRMQEKVLEGSREAVFEQMSEAMKRLHVEELIATANLEPSSVPGMSPEQAVMALHYILARPDFAFVEALCPELKGVVEERIAIIQTNRLPTLKHS